MRCILLNPGPVSLSDAVRRAAFNTDLGHHEPEFFELVSRVKGKLIDAYELDADEWVAVPMGGSGHTALEASMASLLPRDGRLLAIGNGFVEPGGAGPGVSFVSTDEMWLGYRLPIGVSEATLRFIDRFGANGLGQQAWDWEAGTLIDVSVDDLLDGRFIDPAGNVFVRVGANRQQFEGGFVELPMSPQSFTLEWSEG